MVTEVVAPVLAAALLAGHGSFAGAKGLRGSIRPHQEPPHQGAYPWRPPVLADIGD